MSTVVKESGGVRVISPNMTVKSRPIGDLVQDRVFARQLGTGIMRGTQGVGTGGVKIDSANNRITLGSITLDGNTNTITIENTDGSTLGLGPIPDTAEFGFFATDTEGDLVMKIINGTLYTYDLTTGDNRVQIGRLTNGEYGGAFAKDGEDLVDALGS